MADGDVLQLDSAQPGGSGSIDGQDKFNWAAPAAPTAAAIAAALGFTAIRKIASGTTTINASTETTVATFTRNAGEIPLVFTWLAPNVAGIKFGTGFTGDIGAYCYRTTTANQSNAIVENNTATNRSVEWVVIGVVP